jgi:bifunctional DNA-binding transcriptional regulator/antitoxin component of YhaV-PrlF toxin-antitoxin module
MIPAELSGIFDQLLCFFQRKGNVIMEIRKVSSTSRVTLPKEFAGKFVCVEKMAEGILQIKTAEFIPDSEKIFHSADYRKRLDRFDKWMDHHTPDDTDTEKLIEGRQK